MRFTTSYLLVLACIPLEDGPLGLYPDPITSSSVYWDGASGNPQIMLRPSAWKDVSAKYGIARSYTYERPYLRSVAFWHVQSVLMYRKEDP
jgi:hypothetical protein